MIISDDFVIKCDFCGREYEISPDTLDVDFAYDERGMGTEIQYIFYGVTVVRDLFAVMDRDRIDKGVIVTSM